MKCEALKYYQKGYNCSQCILKACEQEYGLRLPEDCLNMCGAINTGFGVGGMCSVLIAGVMVFGLLFDETDAKRLRLKLLSEFRDKYPSMDCSVLRRERQRGINCEQLVCDIAELIEKIIKEESR